VKFLSYTNKAKEMSRRPAFCWDCPLTLNYQNLHCLKFCPGVLLWVFENQSCFWLDLECVWRSNNSPSRPQWSWKNYNFLDSDR